MWFAVALSRVASSHCGTSLGIATKDLRPITVLSIAFARKLPSTIHGVRGHLSAEEGAAKGQVATTKGIILGMDFADIRQNECRCLSTTLAHSPTDSGVEHQTMGATALSSAATP